MRVAAAVSALACALLLTGCYVSDKLLLDPAKAAAPLALGRQQLQGSSTETVEITLGPDKWYRVRSGDETNRVLFVPLEDGVADGRYAFASTEREGYIYGVAERVGDRILMDLPFCDLGPARDIAIAHGLGAPAAGKAMSPTCSFKDPPNLRGALRDYANRPGQKPDRPSLAAAL